MTAIVVDGLNGKEYRLPTEQENSVARDAERRISDLFNQIPFGLPAEPVPEGASRSGGGSAFTVFLYGFDQWCKLFTPRQLLTLGTFVLQTRAVMEAMSGEGYTQEWGAAIRSELNVSLDKLVDRQSALCRWD